MCGCDDKALRQEREDITGLALEKADEFLAVDEPSGCATVYAAVPAGFTALVRVNLEAALFGVRSLVASAFVPPGFKGPVITVTGMQVDGWHVTFQSANSQQRIRAGIQAGRGCAAFSVFVPQRLQVPPPGAPALLLQENPAPFGRLDGIPSIYTEDGGNVVTLREGERILAIAAKASAGADGEIALALPLDVNQLITIDAGDAYRLEPAGSIGGAGTITFVNVDRFTVYTVR